MTTEEIEKAMEEDAKKKTVFVVVAHNFGDHSEIMAVYEHYKDAVSFADSVSPARFNTLDIRPMRMS